MTRSSEWRSNHHLLLLLSFLSLTHGCSYAFVHGPPAPGEVSPGDGQQSPPFAASCTTSNALPVLDTLGAISFFGAGVLGFVGAAENSNCGSDCWTGSPGEWVAVGAAATALGSVLLASAITGYGRTADCRRAQEMLPGPHRQSARYLLDVSGIAEARAGAERAGN